jgi:transcription elongation GreA/GreB family factor
MFDHRMTKAHLRDELAQVLAGEIDILARAQTETQQAATHEEAKPENDKDTRALEQSYLARGQAQRVESLRAALAAVSAMPIERHAPEQPIALGSWVRLESLDDGKSAQFYLAPAGGGIRLQGESVQVVTSQAPFGRAMLGKRLGDEVEVLISGRTSGFHIAGVM